MTIDFFVAGTPRPAGSKRAFALKKRGAYTGRVAVIDDCATSRDWKSRVSQDAAIAFSATGQLTLIECALRVRIVFTVKRPQSHFKGEHGNILRPSARQFPTVRPDVLKLARAVEDAITGIIWRDDAQIVSEEIIKQYGDRPGVGIIITTEI